MSRNFASIALVVSSVLSLSGQTSFGQAVTSGLPFSTETRGVAPGYGYGWGFGYHSSTAFEGYARGVADVIRARGEADLNHALAARQWEAALKERIDVDAHRIYVRNELRDNYNQRQEKVYAIAREKLEVYLAKIRLTDLTPQELNRNTGEIAWPTLLANQQYSEYSQLLNNLFVERAKYGNLSPSDVLEAGRLMKQWREDLTASRNQIPEAMLHDSLRFLLRLDRELNSKWS